MWFMFSQALSLYMMYKPEFILQAVLYKQLLGLLIGRDEDRVLEFEGIWRI